MTIYRGGNIERTSYISSAVNVDGNDSTVRAGKGAAVYGANVNVPDNMFDHIIIEQNPVTPVLGSNSTVDEVLVEMLKNETDTSMIKVYLHDQPTDLKTSAILMTTIAESNLAFSDKAELIDEVLVLVK